MTCAEWMSLLARIFSSNCATGALQKSFQDRAGDRGRIDLVNFAAVIDVEGVHAFRRDLRKKSSELFPETQMRSNDRQCFGVQVRHVDGVANCSFEQGCADR